MANRDLFQPQNKSYNQTSYNPNWQQPKRGIGGFVAQMLLATCIFSAIVYLYDNEGTLGNGVRYVVAMAQVQDANLDSENLMAVGNFFNATDQTDQPNITDQTADITDDTPNKTNQPNPTDTDQTQENTDIQGTGSIEVLPSWTDIEMEKLTLILPATGLMQANFGDKIGETTTDYIEIYCQGTQTVKAAAIGKVVEIHDGEKLVIEHQDGIKTVYTGDLKITAKLGEELRQGATIATLTEGTLKFKVLENNLAVNPFLFLEQPENTK